MPGPAGTKRREAYPRREHRRCGCRTHPPPTRSVERDDASPRRRREAQRLRSVVDCLPYETRVAMLEGIGRYDRIIVGAYTDRTGGVCPMLAAHRCGGRTDFRSFARAWDGFTGAGRRARSATERELRTLTAQLEASVWAEDELRVETLRTGTPGRRGRDAPRPRRGWARSGAGTATATRSERPRPRAGAEAAPDREPTPSASTSPPSPGRASAVGAAVLHISHVRSWRISSMGGAA